MKKFRVAGNGVISPDGLSGYLSVSEARIVPDFRYLKIVESLGIGVSLRLDLNPYDNGKSQPVIRRMIADRASELKISRVMNNRGAIEEQVAFLRNLIGRIENNRTRAVNVQYVVKVTEHHPAILKDSLGRIESAFAAMGIRTKLSRFIGRRRLLSVTNPFSTSRGNYLMDSTTLGGILPVSFSPEPHLGILIGIDESNEYPVFQDIFEGNSYNCIVSGETGSGKSFFTKLLVSRMLRNELVGEVRIVDPLGEYSPELFPGFSDKVAIIHSENVDAEKLIGEITAGFSASGRKLLVIDEAHRLLETSPARIALDRLARHSRHKNLSVILITQNLTDFFGSEEGRSLVSNSGNIISFRNKPFQLSKLSSVSEPGTDSLDTSGLMGGRRDPYSECIFIHGSEIRRIRVICTVKEHRMLSSSAP